MAEPGRVKALRALFDKSASKPQSPAEFDGTRKAVARHNLRYAARRASRLATSATVTGGSDAQEAKSRKLPIVFAESKAEWMTFGDAGAFWLPEFDEAVASDDTDSINRAALKVFFEEHDPKRVDEVDVLLDANKGRELELFTELSVQYPEPSFGTICNLVEAEKELAEGRNWATFDDEDKPILNGMRRPTGAWAVNYSPWDDST